jgi:hypothetical protein
MSWQPALPETQTKRKQTKERRRRESNEETGATDEK